MAKDKEEVKDEAVERVEDSGNEQHLDRDPNDPRTFPKAEPNISDLNADDPEK